MKQHQSPVGKSDVWGTPAWIMNALGDFDLDPCATESRLLPNIMAHYTKEGLTLPWMGRVWCNPPFSRVLRSAFMHRMAEHNNGILLIPAACETEPFRQYVFGRASGMLMLGRRPHFIDEQGNSAKANSGCTICLVAYGDRNLECLLKSKLGVVLQEVMQ